ncbi:MAG: hypothetical protein FWH29_01100 [Methanobrevibacter sp.]|nr:hypothetical protein [Methanobrevibacter sp.]
MPKFHSPPFFLTIMRQLSHKKILNRRRIYKPKTASALQTTLYIIQQKINLHV